MRTDISHHFLDADGGRIRVISEWVNDHHKEMFVISNNISNIDEC